jgi:hypothetical protein
MSDFTIKFLGSGARPLRTEQVSAAHDSDVGRFALTRLCASRVFARALVYEGADLRLEVDRSG